MLLIIYTCTSNKRVLPIVAGSKACLKFIAARALIRSFTVVDLLYMKRIEQAKVSILTVSRLTLLYENTHRLPGV